MLKHKIKQNTRDQLPHGPGIQEAVGTYNSGENEESPSSKSARQAQRNQNTSTANPANMITSRQRDSALTKTSGLPDTTQGISAQKKSIRPIIISEQRREDEKNTGKEKRNNNQRKVNIKFKPHKITESKSIEVDFDSVSVASFSSATVTSQSSTSKVIFRRKSFSAKKQKDILDGFCSPSPPTSTCGLDSETGMSHIEGHNKEGQSSDHSSTLRVRTELAHLVSKCL